MGEAALEYAPPPETPKRRIVRIAAWIVGILAVIVALRLAGIDVWGWLEQLWSAVTDISLRYVILGCLLQGAQTLLTALGWYGILRYAYPGGVTFMLHGTPIEEREPDESYPLSGFRESHVTSSGAGMLVGTAFFDDGGAPAYLDFDRPGNLDPVPVEGLAHEGAGELESIRYLEGDRFALIYNIDGCSWAYEARLDEPGRRLRVERVLVGRGALEGGILHGLHFDEESGRYALSYCTATDPTQLWVLEADDAREPARKTRERVLGVAPGLLSAGEDASFESHDGLRVSARLYLPSDELGHDGPRPLVYYVHGGPQSQERPNFAWFSMPLVQILTLEGFAVFVPNVRGSSGYGLEYMVVAFTQEHGLAQAEVRIELVDGSRHVLATATAEPGFGFLSFTPHAETGGEPRRVIVPIGAVKTIEISAPDPESPFGFAGPD